jgi:hypothetical protein
VLVYGSLLILVRVTLAKTRLVDTRANKVAMVSAKMARVRHLRREIRDIIVSPWRVCPQY